MNEELPGNSNIRRNRSRCCGCQKAVKARNPDESQRRCRQGHAKLWTSKSTYPLFCSDTCS